LMLTHKLWPLQRLSVFIGLALFLPYYFVGASFLGTQEPPLNEWIFRAMMLFRLSFYLFEVAVDIVIDAEIHNDLLALEAIREAKRNVKESSAQQQHAASQQPKPVDFRNAFCSISNSRDYFLTVTNSVILPETLSYQGSFFAWSVTSVYTEGVWNKEPCGGRMWRPIAIIYWVSSLPFLLTFIILGLLILFCYFISLLPLLLDAVGRCCKQEYTVVNAAGGRSEQQRQGDFCNNLSNYWKELSNV